MTVLSRLALVVGIVTGAAVWSGSTALAQGGSATLPAAVGLYNWIHTTGDAEKSFPFYRDVLGIELARNTFGGPAPAVRHQSGSVRCPPVPATP